VHLDDVGIVAANTTRSRVYLQALVQSELVPSFVLVMEEGSKTLPGQSALDKQKERSKERSSEEIEFFELKFRPGESLKTTLQDSVIPYGGYLPDYKGSTTNYYSMISDNECGASSIFLNEEIDCGPVLLRRKFPAPHDRLQLDYVYDSMIRAKVLVETMQSYVGRNRKWEFEMENNQGGTTYFIMHPVLRHIAILAG
jgi:methionyl-tRNA formyltransferase